MVGLPDTKYKMDLVRSEIVTERVDFSGDEITSVATDVLEGTPLYTDTKDGGLTEITLTDDQLSSCKTELHSYVEIDEDEEDLSKEELIPCNDLMTNSINEVWIKEEQMGDDMEEEDGEIQGIAAESDTPESRQKMVLFFSPSTDVVRTPRGFSEKKVKLPSKPTDKPDASSLRTYVCKFCHVGFSDVMALYQHALKHAGSQPFQCQSCKMRFTTKAELWIHEERHVHTKPLQCPHCDHLSHTEVQLQKHLKLHSRQAQKQGPAKKAQKLKDSTPSTPPPKASLSKVTKGGDNQRVTSKAHSKPLLKTLADFKKENPFSCEYCPRGFRSALGLASHRKVHIYKRYKCQFCDMPCSSVESLKCHIAQRHRSHAKRMSISKEEPTLEEMN